MICSLTSDLNLNITSWETDTSLEPDAYIFTSSGVNENNILSYTSSTGIFVRSTGEPTVNMYRMWVLEDINFRIGDADLSGNIDIKDETLIQKCLSDLSGFEFNNLSYYLSDFNGDGVVTVKDATDIRKFVSDIT